jgi:hypothetical protein
VPDLMKREPVKYVPGLNRTVPPDFAAVSIVFWMDAVSRVAPSPLAP